MNKRQLQYLKNKNRETIKMKEWQESHKKPCPSCGEIIRYRSIFCKKCSQLGTRSSLWKGENAVYVSIHNWIRKILGTPSKCQACGTTTAKRFDWANLSGKYKRSLNDWIRLCRSCHIRRDIKFGRGASLIKKSKDMVRLVVD